MFRFPPRRPSALLSERVGKLAHPKRLLVRSDLRNPPFNHSECKGTVAKVGQINWPRDSDPPGMAPWASRRDYLGGSAEALQPNHAGDA
jgi:hypothetical protein